MNKSAKHIDNFSLTAFRVFAIFQMLKEAPHSESEINEKLKDHEILARSISRDSIWLYINTLKALGCQITRPSKKNNYKYILKDHPFKINLTEQELNALTNARKHLSNISKWDISNNYDKFLVNIAQYLEEDSRKKLLNSWKNISREIDYSSIKDMINEIEHHCTINSVLSINYSSSAENISVKNLIVEYLKYENGALYLWGYNIDIDETQYLRVDRIISFKELDTAQIKDFVPPIKVKYKLQNPLTLEYQPDEFETIISEDETGIIVEANMYNKFQLIQKLMSYGKNCVVLEPKNFRNEFVDNLKQLARLYNG